MLYIYTGNLQEQWQLERQFSLNKNHYEIPQKHSNLISDILTKITYQYFQNKIPMVVQKIKEMMVRALNSTYSLKQYRETMDIIKKEHENMHTYREHLIALNRAFAQDDAELFAQKQYNQGEDQDLIFQQAMKGQAYQYSQLEQLYELPIISQLEIKEDSDTNTEKTVKSDLQWTQLAIRDSQGIAGMGTTKLESLFSGPSEFTYSDWKTSRKGSTCQDTSRQMKSFSRKKSTIFMANPNIDEAVKSEMKYDLNREVALGSSIMEGLDSPRTFNHQRKIRDTIRNIKLKMRRK